MKKLIKALLLVCFTFILCACEFPQTNQKPSIDDPGIITGEEYSIEYVLNDGFFTTTELTTYISGNEYDLPIPKKIGYTFNGWYDYETSEQFEKITKTTTGDIKIYALYKKATITGNITYHLDGGVIEGEYKDTYIEGEIQTLPKPKKDGYYFRGWYKTSDYKTPVAAISATTYGDVEYFALWEEATMENTTFGILGDSISTFYSPTSDVNSIFNGENQFYYPRYSKTVTSASQTWWYQTVNALGAKIHVNNSYSGGTVCGNSMSCGEATTRLAKFNKVGVSPDVIIIYLGINDAVGKTPVATFKKSYQNMLDNIARMYSSAEVFVCTLPYETYTDGEYRELYNDVIRELAVLNNLTLIDFSNAWSSKTEVKNNWTHLDDNIHPGRTGMQILAKIATDTIKEAFDIA